ncbi:cellulose biosynthesis protein BcsE [Burkholderia savannae]|uniref:Cellulose biosynthesis protein BcsE n=1 Tax=Burkholderia savannae TaxID=1637837 RepID=A0ABR5TBD5_9BURK|nr:cellulose biosynthesis protein BcsE [Burkholderia savannae]
MNTESDSARYSTLGARLLAGVRAFGRTRTPPAGADWGRLAIDALPGEWTKLEPGGLYAVYAAARTPGCDALVWESARQAGARDVTVVLACDARSASARLRERGFANAARGWPRRLNVLAMPVRSGGEAGKTGETGEAVKSPFAALAGGLAALKRFGFRANALYFVEGAERWFDWSDPAALAEEGRALAAWCLARRIAVVLLLGDASPDGASGQARDAAPDDRPIVRDARRAQLGGFHRACAGVAQLQRSHGELLWVVDFWRTRGALATGEARALRFTPAGRLTAADDSAADAREAQRLAADEARVVVSRAVVGNETWTPDEWEVVSDNDAVLAACTAAHAATAVLAYAGHAQLEALCAIVHALRRGCGGALKIVVVERGEVLRHHFELLMLSLGANQVIARDLPHARVLAVLRSLQGQLYARPVPSDYRAALAALLGEGALGYLPVGAFCLHVRAVLERSAALVLPHALVKLTLLPGVAHADALRACVPRRAGDVLTADAQHVYLFLFACELPDVRRVLDRLFQVPVERVSDRIVHLANESIKLELDRLLAANRRAPIADYSDLFPRAHAARPADEPIAEKPSADTAGRRSDAIEACASAPAAVSPPPEAAVRHLGDATRFAMPLRDPKGRP